MMKTKMMKTKQNRLADGWSILLLAAALALGSMAGCEEEPVAPGGTVILEIQTIFVKSTAGEMPDGEMPDQDGAEGRVQPPAIDARDARQREGSAAPGAQTFAVDRVVASIIDVASGEALAEEELTISGSTASGRMSVDVYGSVEAEVRIRMFEAGLLTYLGSEHLLLVPNGVFHPVVVLSDVPPSGVRGTVQNQQTSQPVVGATALLVETGHSTTSGGGGIFSLETPPGTYTLRISAIGYETAADRQVTVSDTTMTDIGVVTLVPTTVPSSGVRGRVENAQTGTAVVGATILLVETASSTTTGTSGDFELRVDPGSYTLRISATGFATRPDTSITVTADVISDVGTILLTPSAGGTSGVRGEVQNAQQEQPIVGATVLLVEPGLSTTTNAQGEFELQADAGSYTLRVSATGFTSTDQQVTLVAGAVHDVGVVALVPQQAGDEVVIVLTWGADPRDLDAHLSGPVLGQAERFHVYYSFPGSTTASPFAHLDRDWQSGEGPETITIAQRFTGTYRFLVHDYTNRFSSPGSPSTALANSGARVRVIINNQEVQNIPVPTGQPGSLWHVLDVDGATGAITILNSFSYEELPGNIG